MSGYQDILASMQESYRSLTGHHPDDASDIGIRLKVLAAQLELLTGQLAETAKQTNPLTATGEHLDRHAQMRGLARKPAVAAQGVLRFSRGQSAGQPLLLPAGLICQPAGDETLRVQTTHDVTLPADALWVDCPAQVVEPGSGGNLAAEVVTVMVTPAQGMTAVTNPAPFEGGQDAESDSLLRQRLLQSYRNISNGVNRAYYLGQALAFEGIASAAVLPLRRGTGTVDVVVSGAGHPPAAPLLERMQQHFDCVREVGVDVLLLPAAELPLDLELTIAPEEGADFEAVCNLCRQTVAELFDSLAVGQPLLLAVLGRRLMETPGVYNYAITAPTADLHLLGDQILRLGSPTFARMAVV